MEDYWIIPMQYQKGIFGLSDFAQNENEEISIEIEYEEYGEIVTCNVPNWEGRRELILYGIPREEFEQTLQAHYSDDGRLKKITANIENKEKLLYIYYADAQDAKKEITSFAIQTADAMAAEIVECQEEVYRLFVEYFCDGDAMDYHALVGTVAEKIALEKKYPQWPDIADSCGDYTRDFVNGDNDGLAIRVKCAGNGEEDFFLFAVELMTERIKEKVAGKLKLAEDFKFSCEEYD